MKLVFIVFYMLSNYVFLYIYCTARFVKNSKYLWVDFKFTQKQRLQPQFFFLFFELSILWTTNCAKQILRNNLTVEIVFNKMPTFANSYIIYNKSTFLILSYLRAKDAGATKTRSQIHRYTNHVYFCYISIKWMYQIHVSSRALKWLTYCNTKATVTRFFCSVRVVQSLSVTICYLNHIPPPTLAVSCLAWWTSYGTWCFFVFAFICKLSTLID